MNSKPIRLRAAAARRLIKRRNIDALILTRPSNVTYLTAFSGDDSWALLSRSNVYLLTDSRYTEQARNECLDCRIIQRTASLADAAAELKKRLRSVRRLAVEKSASLADFEQLRKSLGARPGTVAGILESVRAVKDPAEVSAISTGAAVAAKALRRTRRYIKPGITENELAARLDFQIRTLNAVNSFETIVAFGPNASRPHHRPGPRKLKSKDTVLIDFGARYKGYCSDITRCFTLGPPTPFYRRAYDAVDRARAAAIKRIRAGARLSEVDAAARDTIRNSDLPVYGHGTGHGLGLEIHEEPFLKLKAPGTLKAGQVITIEPGIYIPGRLGVRIEDDVLVTETGCTVLTDRCPRSCLLNP